MAEAGVRVGALIDRAVVAERLTARAAPLTPPPPRPAAPGATERRRDEGVVALDVDFGAVDRVRAGTAVDRRAFVAFAAIDAGRRLGHAVDVGVAGAADLRLAALAERLAPTGGFAVAGLGVLTIGDVAMRPVAVATDDGSWAIAVRPVGRLLLTSADGAPFLDAVRDLLEHRGWSLP